MLSAVDNLNDKTVS
jgi:hypothetical protein